MKSPSEHAPEEEPKLLDMEWIEVQKNSFTAWCNSHLSKRQIKITDLTEDFRTGEKLKALIEVISGDQLPALEHGKRRIAWIIDVNKCLDYLSKKLQLMVSAEEIVDGNPKMILGLIWMIILRFSIQEISVGERSAKEGLLLWCQRKTQGYPGVSVKNFVRSFNDGKALCALIHRHRPDLLDYNQLNMNNHLENITKAVTVAEEKLEIPQMMDPKYLAKSHETGLNVDDKSMMTYISMFFHKFAGSQRCELATERIKQRLTDLSKLDKLKNNFELLSSQLLEWIHNKNEWLMSREVVVDGDYLEFLQNRNKEFLNYIVDEKPAKLREKIQIQSILNDIQTMIRTGNQPPYYPGPNLDIGTINSEWNNLEKNETAFKIWINEEIERLQKIRSLVKRFTSRVELYNRNLHNIEGSLNLLNTSVDTLHMARGLIRKCEYITNEFDSLEISENLDTVISSLQPLNYSEIDQLIDQKEKLEQFQISLEALNAEKMAQLEHIIQYLKEVDEIDDSCAQMTLKIKNKSSKCEDDVNRGVQIRSVKGIEEFENYANKANDDYKGIIEILKRLEAKNKMKSEIEVRENCSLPQNQYTSINYDDLVSMVHNLGEKVAKFTEQMEIEKNKFLKQDELCKRFAALAESLDETIDKFLADISAIMLNYDSFELKKASLEEMRKKVNDEQSKYNETIEICREFDNYDIIVNPYTNITPEIIASKWDLLISKIHNDIDSMTSQIVIRDSRGTTEEQIAEFRKAFNQIAHEFPDKLIYDEFKGLLLSQGIDVSDSNKGNAEFERIVKIVDPNKTGFVYLPDFIQFMMNESTDKNSADELINNFKILANDREEYITKEEMAKELPKEDVDYCIAHMKKYEGSDAPDDAYDYRSFIDDIYTPTSAF